MNAFLRAGELDRRVTIQRRTTEKDARGQRLDAWIDVASVWAKQRPIRYQHGNLGAGSEQTAATVIWTIRFRTDVSDQEMRVKYLADGSLYEIDEVSLFGRRVGLELHCRKVT